MPIRRARASKGLREPLTVDVDSTEETDNGSSSTALSRHQLLASRALAGAAGKAGKLFKGRSNSGFRGGGRGRSVSSRTGTNSVNSSQQLEALQVKQSMNRSTSLNSMATHKAGSATRHLQQQQAQLESRNSDGIAARPRVNSAGGADPFSHLGVPIATADAARQPPTSVDTPFGSRTPRSPAQTQQAAAGVGYLSPSARDTPPRFTAAGTATAMATAAAPTTSAGSPRGGQTSQKSPRSPPKSRSPMSRNVARSTAALGQQQQGGAPAASAYVATSPTPSDRYEIPDIGGDDDEGGSLPSFQSFQMVSQGTGTFGSAATEAGSPANGGHQAGGGRPRATLGASRSPRSAAPGSSTSPRAVAVATSSSPRAAASASPEGMGHGGTSRPEGISAGRSAGGQPRRQPQWQDASGPRRQPQQQQKAPNSPAKSAYDYDESSLAMSKRDGSSQYGGAANYCSPPASMSMESVGSQASMSLGYSETNNGSLMSGTYKTNSMISGNPAASGRGDDESGMYTHDDDDVTATICSSGAESETVVSGTVASGTVVSSVAGTYADETATYRSADETTLQTAGTADESALGTVGSDGNTTVRSEETDVSSLHPQPPGQSWRGGEQSSRGRRSQRPMGTWSRDDEGTKGRNRRGGGRDYDEFDTDEEGGMGPDSSFDYSAYRERGSRHNTRGGGRGRGRNSDADPTFSAQSKSAPLMAPMSFQSGESGVDTYMIKEDDDYYYVKQKYGYLSIALSITQIAILATMMALCGVAPIDVNVLVGPYPDALSEWGGKNAYLMLNENEWWRLISPAFLHVGVIHLLCNAYVQLETGAFFEREWGSVRWFVIYVCSAVGSILVSCILDPNTISVGSSGAIMGLFGAKLSEVLTLNMFETQHRRDGPEGSAGRIGQLGGVMCSVIVVSAFSAVPFVDWSGHMGGLATGFFLGIIVFGKYIKSLCYRVLWVLLGLVLAAVGIGLAVMELLDGVRPSSDLGDACEYFRTDYEEGYDCTCAWDWFGFGGEQAAAEGGDGADGANGADERMLRWRP